MSDLRCRCGVPITPTLVGYTHSPTAWMGNRRTPRPSNGPRKARSTDDPGGEMTLERHPGEWTYDSEAGAAYVYLRGDHQVAVTREVPAMVMLDYDKAGRVIGIEVIAKWPEESS